MAGSEIKVGDEVRVFDVNGRRMGMPEGGWPGTVLKVGRSLVTIQAPRCGGVFRLDTRRSNDSWAHGSFMTVEEAAESVRYEKASETLRELGIQIIAKCEGDFTAADLEALVKLVRSFGGKR